MSDARVCRRSFPFREHRTIGEVYECHALMAIYRTRARRLTHAEHVRLLVLQSRATEPDRDPPPAVA